MKRIVLLTLLLLSLHTVRAQSDNEIVSGSSDITYGRDVRAGSTALQTNSNRNDDLCHFFLESILGFEQYGSTGYGANFAYVHNWCGGYLSATVYRSHLLYTGGIAVRPLPRMSAFDWQLYGGFAYANPIDSRIGFEVGTRFAANAYTNGGQFAWWSLSVSHVSLNGNSYLTLGLSISLSSICGLWVLF